MQINDSGLYGKADFPVNHVGLRGNAGRIVLQGDQLRNQFVKDPKHSVVYYETLKD